MKNILTLIVFITSIGLTAKAQTPIQQNVPTTQKEQKIEPKKDCCKEHGDKKVCTDSDKKVCTEGTTQNNGKSSCGYDVNNKKSCGGETQSPNGKNGCKDGDKKTCTDSNQSPNGKNCCKDGDKKECCKDKKNPTENTPKPESTPQPNNSKP